MMSFKRNCQNTLFDFLRALWVGSFIAQYQYVMVNKNKSIRIPNQENTHDRKCNAFIIEICICAYILNKLYMCINGTIYLRKVLGSRSIKNRLTIFMISSSSYLDIDSQFMDTSFSYSYVYLGMWLFIFSNNLAVLFVVSLVLWNAHVVKSSSNTTLVHLSVNTDGNIGTVVLEVHPEWAPLGANRFLSLVRENFYDDARFFRVIKVNLVIARLIYRCITFALLVFHIFKKILNRFFFSRISWRRLAYLGILKFPKSGELKPYWTIRSCKTTILEEE